MAERCDLLTAQISQSQLGSLCARNSGKAAWSRRQPGCPVRRCSRIALAASRRRRELTPPPLPPPLLPPLPLPPPLPVVVTAGSAAVLDATCAASVDAELSAATERGRNCRTQAPVVGSCLRGKTAPVAGKEMAAELPPAAKATSAPSRQIEPVERSVKPPSGATQTLRRSKGRQWPEASRASAARSPWAVMVVLPPATPWSCPWRARRL